MFDDGRECEDGTIVGDIGGGHGKEVISPNPTFAVVFWKVASIRVDHDDNVTHYGSDCYSKMCSNLI